MGDKGKLPPLNACYMTTDFENMSYEDMLAMVRGVDPTAIMSRGTALIDAQTEIEKIGTELKEHVSRTTWKGKGGDAFREWGDGFAKETIKLADYAGAAGTSLQTAGQALSEVSKVIQGHSDATSMCYADEAKEKARLEAVDKARNEAIPQMNKLASYYMMAQQTISSQEEPVFKPLPDAVIPDKPVGGGQQGYGPSSGGNAGTHSVSTVPSTGGSSGTYHSVTAQPVDGGSSSVSHVTTPTPSHHVGAVPVTPGAPDTTGTNIDTVTMPDAPPVTSTPPTSGPPVTPVGGGGQNNLPPVVLPTQTLPTGPGGGGNRRTIPVGPGTDGNPRANPLGPGADGNRRTMPVTPVGRGGAESVRPPVIPRADTGIHGGTPGRPVTGPVAGGQRGTVIGNERPGVGRSMMGGHGMGAVGSPMGRGGVGGAAGSRRLVTQPGGTVGEARGGAAGREFTPGGSGLVRESARPGAMGPMGGAMGGSRGTRRPQRRDGENPDYLEEDEETWATGDDVVPPVID